MALGNIVGDLGYLGFAFSATGFVSTPKLFGALFTLFAHVILLAYGDDDARKVGGEGGGIANFITRLRFGSQKYLTILPTSISTPIKVRPVGVSFAMLAMNGIGLVVDAMGRVGFSNVVQGALGSFIILGTGCFALAGFTKDQHVADAALRLAPRLLAACTIVNAVLAVTTMNPFLLAGAVAFIVANLAGFYAKIDKKMPDSAAI